MQLCVLCKNLISNVLGTTCKGLDRLRSYPNQMLMKPIPVIKSKSTKLNLITETLSSHMEAWKSLFSDWCTKTCRKTNPTNYPSLNGKFLVLYCYLHHFHRY